MTTLPFDSQIPLIGLGSALLIWFALDLIARRFGSGSLRRHLLLASRLSVCMSLALASLGWWIGELLDPQVIDLPLDGLGIRSFFAVVGFSWTLLRWKGVIEAQPDRYGERLLPGLEKKDRTFLLDVIGKLLLGLALLVLVLHVMRLLGISAAVLITAGGFGAAAVGFGAQSIVSNSLSGLSLYVNRPFVVGDYIDIPSENLSGTVEKISWFYTRLRSVDRQPLFVPNAIFSAKPVINISEIDNRRVWIEFGLNYANRALIPGLTSALESWLRGHPDVDASRTLAVNFIGYGDSSLNLRLVCHARGATLMDAWALQEKVLLEIGAAVDRCGASMPFPTRTLLQG